MTSHSGQEITLSAALIWLQLCAIFFLANVIFNVSHHDSGRERRKYQFVLYHSYGQTLTERQQWVQNRNEKAPSGCHFMVLLWKSLPSGWMQNVGGINDMWYRRGEGADSCAFGREGWRGEMKTYFERATAVAESLEVLTCILGYTPAEVPCSLFTDPSGAAGEPYCVPVLSWDYNPCERGQTQMDR